MRTIRRLLLLTTIVIAASGSALGIWLAVTATDAPATPTCTDTWTGASGGWTTAADWSTGKVPTSSDDVCLTATTTTTPAAAADTYTVTTNAAISVHTITIGGSTGTQTLDQQVTSSGNVVLSLGAAGSTIQPNGVLRFDSSSSNYTDLTGSSLTNSGHVLAASDPGTEYLDAGFVNAAGGSVEIASADVRQDTGTATVNQGTWTVDSGGVFKDTSGSFENSGSIADSGTFTASGITFTQDGTGNSGTNAVTFAGGVTFTDSTGGGAFVAESSNTITGTIPTGQSVAPTGSALGNGVLSVSGAVTNNGTITLDSAAAAQYADMNGSGTLTNNGLVKTVQDAGNTRYIEVNLTNTAGGNVEIAAADTRQDTGTHTINNGTWTVDAAGAFKDTSGTFDDEGAIVNNGTFTASGITFTQHGTGNSGPDPVTFAGGVTFTDNTGGGAFVTESSNTITGTIPTGQSVAAHRLGARQRRALGQRSGHQQRNHHPRLGGSGAVRQHDRFRNPHQQRPGQDRAGRGQHPLHRGQPHQRPDRHRRDRRSRHSPGHRHPHGQQRHLGG